ncbi:hypothetical protein EDB86DRAFT_2926897, partial [Lactarius hatsudake]
RIILSALGLSFLAFSYARRNHRVLFSSASSGSYIQTLTIAEVGLGTFGSHQDMPVHHPLPVLTRQQHSSAGISAMTVDVSETAE